MFIHKNHKTLILTALYKLSATNYLTTSIGIFLLPGTFLLCGVVFVTRVSLRQVAPSQDPKAATSSSTTCRRSLAMPSWCRCSFLLEMWSPPRCSLIEPPTRASASVSDSCVTRPLTHRIMHSILVFPHFGFLDNRFPGQNPCQTVFKVAG